MSSAPQYLSSLRILEHVIRLAARLDCRVITTCWHVDAFPFNQEVVQAAYTKEGVPEKFRNEDVRFVAAEQFAAASAIQAMNFQENTAVQFMVGSLAGNTAIVLGGKPHDCINFGGTATLHNMAIMVASSQHFLISAELFAAQAFLSQDEEQIGTLFGEELIKMLIVGISLVGVLALLVGSPILLDWLRT
jgi:hypothetical protein